jgi:glutathione reductase (NADPH)
MWAPVFAQPKPLRGFDEEVRDFVTEQYGVHGLNLHPTASPTKIEKGADGKLTLTAESKSEGKVRAPEQATLQRRQRWVMGPA